MNSTNREAQELIQQIRRRNESAQDFRKVRQFVEENNAEILLIEASLMKR